MEEPMREVWAVHRVKDGERILLARENSLLLAAARAEEEIAQDRISGDLAGYEIVKENVAIGKEEMPGSEA